MKIHADIKQGSTEWHRLRAFNFTASKLDTWALDPVKITLTVDDIKALLDASGIARKGTTKRDDLLELLPNAEAYAKLCDGAQTAIIAAIKAERMQLIRDKIALHLHAGDPMPWTQEEEIMFSREEELAAKDAKSFEYNIPVKYGNLLEPFAREYYEHETGHEVTEVGFVEDEGFGCSPDGLIADALGWSHGLEIKCPIPETHIAWLLEGSVPKDHRLQCHAGMACTGLNRWDFVSYCPGEKTLIVSMHRDDDTEKLAAGLKTLVAEKAKMKKRLALMWEGSK